MNLQNLNRSELFSKVFINVILFSVFISIFFFTYGTYIEKSVVSSQMDILTTNLTDSSKLLGYNTNELITNYINNIKLPDLSKEDNDINNINNNIIYNVIKINLLFIIVSIGILYYVYKKSNNSFDLEQIISNNLVILLFIGLTEFLFLTFFGSKFISIDPNQTKLSILKSIKKYYF